MHSTDTVIELKHILQSSSVRLHALSRGYLTIGRRVIHASHRDEVLHREGRFLGIEIFVLASPPRRTFPKNPLRHLQAFDLLIATSVLQVT